MTGWQEGAGGGSGADGLCSARLTDGPFTAAGGAMLKKFDKKDEESGEGRRAARGGRGGSREESWGGGARPGPCRCCACPARGRSAPFLRRCARPSQRVLLAAAVRSGPAGFAWKTPGAAPASLGCERVPAPLSGWALPAGIPPLRSSRCPVCSPR